MPTTSTHAQSRCATTTWSQCPRATTTTWLQGLLPFSSPHLIHRTTRCTQECVKTQGSSRRECAQCTGRLNHFPFFSHSLHSSMLPLQYSGTQGDTFPPCKWSWRPPIGVDEVEKRGAFTCAGMLPASLFIPLSPLPLTTPSDSKMRPKHMNTC